MEQGKSLYIVSYKEERASFVVNYITGLDFDMRAKESEEMEIQERNAGL